VGFKLHRPTKTPSPARIHQYETHRRKHEHPPQSENVHDVYGGRRVFVDRGNWTHGAQQERAAHQGLTLDHFKAQLEYLQDTSLRSELNLSTFGPHPRINVGSVGDKVSLS